MPANIHTCPEKNNNTSLWETWQYLFPGNTNSYNGSLRSKHCCYVKLCTSSIHYYKCTEIYLTLNLPAAAWQQIERSACLHIRYTCKTHLFHKTQRMLRSAANRGTGSSSAYTKELPLASGGNCIPMNEEEVQRGGGWPASSSTKSRAARWWSSLVLTTSAANKSPTLLSYRASITRLCLPVSHSTSHSHTMSRRRMSLCHCLSPTCALQDSNRTETKSQTLEDSPGFVLYFYAETNPAILAQSLVRRRGFSKASKHSLVVGRSM